jgi:hypothetical protein
MLDPQMAQIPAQLDPLRITSADARWSWNTAVWGNLEKLVATMEMVHGEAEKSWDMLGRDLCYKLCYLFCFTCL